MPRTQQTDHSIERQLHTLRDHHEYGCTLAKKVPAFVANNTCRQLMGSTIVADKLIPSTKYPVENQAYGSQFTSNVERFIPVFKTL